MEMVMDVVCINCGVKFTAVRMTARYCSDRCRVGYRKRGGSWERQFEVLVKRPEFRGKMREFYEILVAMLPAGSTVMVPDVQKRPDRYTKVRLHDRGKERRKKAVKTSKAVKEINDPPEYSMAYFKKYGVWSK